MRSFFVVAMLLASGMAFAREVPGRQWVGRSEVPGASENAAIAERDARTFIAAHLPELVPGASIDELVLATNVAHDGKRTVSFWQTWRGMRVRGGQLHVVIARDAIFFAQSQAVPYVAISLGPEIVDAKHGRVIVTVDGRVRIAEHRVRGTWDEWVGLDGRVLVRENRVRDATSTLVYDVPNPRPSMRAPLPASEASITVDAGAVTTGLDGGFTFAGPTGSVTPALVGPRVRVVDAASAPPTGTLVVSDGQPTTWSLASDEAADAQLSAFVHASIAKARARQIVPGLPWIDQQLTLTVNEPGAACNASSTGDDLHFYAGDATCENTARVADVVYHELGHSLHFQSLIPGVGNYNLALSEGLADFFAVSVTGTSAMGRGYQRVGDAPVRELDPAGFEKIAPDDFVPSQHQSGLIIGGALWDLRRLLIDRHGAVDGSARMDRVFRGVLERAPNISNSYMAALVGDDDDGDLGNGTPNQCEIDVAFARHGLAPADTGITRFGPLDVDGDRVELLMTRGSLACEPEVASAELLVDQPPATTAMTVAPDGLRATLPGTGARAVRFAIEVVYADGTRRHFPENAADPMYSAFVGETSEIWCERFDADPLWTQSLVGSPSPWSWGAPMGLAGDPVAGFTGANVFGTKLDGDGRYASVAQTRVTTPMADASMYREVRLQFRRWLVVEDALYDEATVEVNGTTRWTNALGDGFLTHQDREWRFVDVDVTDIAATAPITVAWTLSTDSSRALGGWNLDDVCLVGIDKIPACGDSIVDQDEECDGNDECRSDCTLDSGCCSIGGDPRSTALLVLAVLAALARRRKR
ncbi:MAG: MYXO-CTERM sorting domain-containing protein [Kofleriaceae bacterium]